jgi:hypothetical protein
MRPEALVPLAHDALIGLTPVDESKAVTLALRIQATLFVRAMELAFQPVVVMFTPVVPAKAEAADKDIRPIGRPGRDRS